MISTPVPRTLVRYGNGYGRNAGTVLRNSPVLPYKYSVEIKHEHIIQYISYNTYAILYLITTNISI